MAHHSRCRFRTSCRPPPPTFSGAVVANSKWTNQLDADVEKINAYVETRLRWHLARRSQQAYRMTTLGPFATGLSGWNSAGFGYRTGGEGLRHHIQVGFGLTLGDLHCGMAQSQAR